MSITERFFYLERTMRYLFTREAKWIFLSCFLVITTTLLRMVQVYGHSIQVDSIFYMALLSEGLRSFLSNLYGRHWGNDQSVRLAKRLYDVVLRKETLNAKMHIMADGMGALVALEMMRQIP